MDMGNQLAEIGLTLPAKRPHLWIRRLTLYASLPEQRVIRTVSLHPGLNIIWSIHGSNQPSGIHNAGKTSFCRLIRHILGETKFATTKNQKRIRSLFPHGGVGAELELHGIPWSVIRPFAIEQPGIAMETDTLGTLLGIHHPPSYDLFLKRLEEQMNDALPVTVFPDQQAPILWGHLLSWIIRDQGAQSGGFHQFRSRRSNSSLPPLSKPVQDALFLFRSVLHLLNEDEPRLRAKIDNIQSKINSVRKEASDRKRESQYQENRLSKRLQKYMDIPMEKLMEWKQDDLLSEDLKDRYEQMIRELKEKQNIHEKDLTNCRKRIDEENKNLGVLLKELDDFKKIVELKRVFLEELESGDPPSDNNPENHWKNRLCDPANIPIIGCSIVQEVWKKERETIDFNRKARGKFTSKQAEKATDELPSYEERVEKLERTIKDAKQQIQSLYEHISEVEKALEGIRERKQRLEDIANEIEQWHERKASRDADGVLLSGQISELNKEKKETFAQIESLKFEYHGRARKLIGIYDALVRNILSSDIRGRVQLDNGEELFGLEGYDTSLGEATNSLATIFGDFASLIYSACHESAHPGLLIHDSPREADLGPQIYHDFLQVVAECQKSPGQGKDIPYQYIVTSATPPPEELQGDKWVPLKISSETDEQLLFATNLDSEHAQESMPF
ncbi:MAG: hypothetical protein HQL74_13870 [Magnetococcales bacterium]|nr:hypothetical protein [Magnetococcales bacterium]